MLRTMTLEDAATSSDVARVFEVDKRSEKNKTWSKRYAMLSRDGASLEFRTTEDEGETPSSSCALRRVRGCVTSTLNIGKQCPAGCGIYIDCEGSKDGIFLRASSAAEATAFVEMVREARARGNSRRSLGTGSTAMATVSSPKRVDGELTQEVSSAREIEERAGDTRALVASPRKPYVESPTGSLDTRGRVLDTFGAMEIALQAKDELLAAEAMGRSSLESALRSEKKLGDELQRKVNSLRERLDSREKELKLVRENLEVEKAYAEELRDQLEHEQMRATEMEDTAAAATMEIERLDRELADARVTRERMEEALLSEGEYARQREAEQFQLQRHLEAQLEEARSAMREMELKHREELADVRRRSANALSVANATEQELLLSRDRLLSELARMRREGYETVLSSGGGDSTLASGPTTPSRARTISMPTTPSRLGQASPSRRVTFKDAKDARTTQVHHARDSPKTPRSLALHPEPEVTPDRTRRALFNRGETRQTSRRLEASRLIDRLDSPGTHGCRVQ